jgi:hypothetical protein
VQLEQDQQVTRLVVEGAEAGHLLDRIVAVQVFECTGVKLIPGGIPAGLIIAELGGKIGQVGTGAIEHVVECGQVRDQRDLVAADANQQPLAVGVLIDIAGQPLGSIDEGVLRMRGVAQRTCAIDASCRGAQAESEARQTGAGQTGAGQTGAGQTGAG